MPGTFRYIRIFARAYLKQLWKEIKMSSFRNRAVFFIMFLEHAQAFARDVELLQKVSEKRKAPGC